MTGPGGSNPAGESPRRRRTGRRWLIAAVILFLLVAVVVVVDMVARSIAQDRVAAGLEQQLPEGIDGDIDVRIGGFSVIQQYLAGNFVEVALTSNGLTVSGLPVDAAATLRGVPVEGTQVSGTIRSADGEITVPGSTITGLLQAQGIPGDIAVADGALAYSTSTTVFGQDIGFDVTAEPTVENGAVRFRPETASVQAGPVSLDGLELLDLVVPNGFAVCVAEYLPAGVELRAVELPASDARIVIGAENLSLAPAALARTGTCS